MDAEAINHAIYSDEDVQAGRELEVESNNVDSLQVMSSRGDVVRELENAGEFFTGVELDIACSSEKLLNLDILVMHVATRESDFEAFASEKGQTVSNTVQNALEFDLLSGILESELKELEIFLLNLQMEISNACETISSKNPGEALKEMHEKLSDCERSLKQSLEQVTEIRVQSDNFNRIILTSAGGKYEKAMESPENSYFAEMNPKIKMQTAEQQRHVLRMLEKSLARELDLEKKLTELRQTEEVLKFRLQQEVFCIEEEFEVAWEKLFEAENAAEILLGMSKELVSKLQILQFNFNGSFQREGELRSKCQELNEQLKAKDSALQNSESTNMELRDKVNSLEKRLNESELQVRTLNDTAEEKQESCSKFREMENLINHLREKVSEAECRAESAEVECKFLKCCNSTSSDRINLLEKQLGESDIQLQHAVAFSEASQEKQAMLYSTIKDMENLIDDLKSKVVKAESQTESVEEKCIILSESNSDLNDELHFLRSRMESLEASLHQVEETKKATVKDIRIRTKLITDLIVQLALERERLHKQTSLLTREKKVLLKRLQQMKKDHPIMTNNDIKERHSTNDFPSANPVEESKGEATELSAASHELNETNDVLVSNAETRLSDSTSKVDAVRNIDARLLNTKYILAAILVLVISALVGFLLQHQNNQI